jgi:quinol monooxygenase YgiN
VKKVTLEGHIIVPDKQLESIKNALETHIQLTRSEQGCLIFDVTQDVDNKNKFNVYEEFTDAESFSAHQVRVSESSWGALSKNLVREYQVTGMPHE